MALETSMRRNSLEDCFSISASVRAAEMDDFDGGFGGEAIGVQRPLSIVTFARRP